MTTATYTADPDCRVPCENHLCRRRDGQLLTGDNGVCHTGARLQVRLETAAVNVLAEVGRRVDVDQAAREADAHLRSYLAEIVGFIRPVFVQRRLADLLHQADHAALVADGWAGPA